MKIFPAVHYSMGGLWVDYERTAAGGLKIGSPQEPADEHPRAVRHRRMRLPVSRRQPPGRQFAVELHLQRLDRRPGDRNAWLKSLPGGSQRPSSRRACSTSAAPASSAMRHDALLKRTGGGENPYRIHQELGEVMTQGGHGRAPQRRAATKPTARCRELEERAEHCSLSDTGNWTNQNVVFTKALMDMFPLAKAILKGALAARRMPRRPFQARVRHAGPRCDRPGRAAAGGRSVVRRFRGEHPQMAQVDDRRVAMPTASRN